MSRGDRPPRSVPLRSRRSVLAAGVAGAFAPFAIATGSAQVPDNAPRVLEVPAGRTVEIDLGDGDSLSDLVIDVSALGAAYHIRAAGTGWEIRNVAVVGQHARTDSTGFAVEVSEEGRGTIDNVYLGDGSRETVGVFVPPDHAGTLTIRRCHIARYPNNGVYASAPGNGPIREDPGAGGVVHIERCYAYNNAISGFRLGTAGSWVRDSVVLQTRRTPASIGGDATRAVWVYYESALIENLDFRMADGTGIAVGNGSWEKSTARVVLRNVRGRATEDLIDGELEDVQGAVDPNPVIEIPEGCPETAADVFDSRVPSVPSAGTGAPVVELPESPAWTPAVFGRVGALSTTMFGPVVGVLVVLFLLLSPGLSVLTIVLFVLYRHGDWPPEW